MEKHDVTTQHPDHAREEKRWGVCRTVTAGAAAIHEAARKLVPRPEGMPGNEFNAYTAGGCPFPAMGRTISGLAGALFPKAPTVEGVDDDLRAALTDVTLTGESLDAFAQRLVHEILEVGRAALIVDVVVDEAGRVRPYLVMRRAEDVTNWRTTRTAHDPSTLTQVVCAEGVETTDEDGFGHDVQSIYREYRLVDGRYVIREWANVAHERHEPQWEVVEEIEPTRRGKPLPFLPIVFVGPRGITVGVDAPPLADLADVIISHYRNSCDHEHALHLTAQPTYWRAGSFDDGDEKLRVGAGVAWNLGPDGKCGVLEFSGAGLAAIRASMAEKEKRMSALGAKLLLEQPSAQEPETATAARLRAGAEGASLRSISNAVSAALTQAVRWMSWWAGTEAKPDTNIKVALSGDLFATRATVQEVATLLQAYNSDALSFESFYEGLKRAGFAREDVTAEEERAQIAASGASATDDQDVLSDEGTVN